MTVLKAKIGGTYQAILSGYASNVFVGPDPPTDPNIQFWVDTDATLPVVPWISMTFNNNWAHYGGVYDPGSYRKIGDIVYFRGLVTAPAAPTGDSSICTLPVGYRPTKTQSLNLIANGGVVRVDVLADGRLSPVFSTVVAYYVNVSLVMGQFSVTA